MITVGIPVYNEGQYIEETILSVIDKADRIIISDNCSTDSTSEICKRYALNNEKIKYIRQESMIDVTRNFQFCLATAETEYFMFLGGHDLVPANYIECLVEKLANDSEAVLAYAPVKYITTSTTNVVEEYDYYYSDELECTDPFIRVLSLIRNLSDCALFHGVFKTSIIRQVFEESKASFNSIGFDQILLCKVAAIGKFVYEPETHFLRRKVREENLYGAILRYIKYYSSDFKLQSIYGDFYKEIREAQISVVNSINDNDQPKKNFWLRESQEVSISRYTNPISIDEYKKKWNTITINGGKLFSIHKKIRNVVIFGTLGMAKKIASECSEGNINVLAFIDNQKEGSINGTPINNMEWLKENENLIDTVLLSIEGPHDLAKISELKEVFPNKLVISWKNLILYYNYTEIYG